MTSAFTCVELPSPSKLLLTIPLGPHPRQYTCTSHFPPSYSVLLAAYPRERSLRPVEGGWSPCAGKKTCKDLGNWALPQNFDSWLQRFSMRGADVQKEKNLKSVLPLVPLNSIYWNGVCHLPLKVLHAWGGQQEQKSFHPSFHVVAKVDFTCLKCWGYIFWTLHSPLSYWWLHRQYLTLALHWLHLTNWARYQDKCLVLLWLSKAVFSACFLSSSGLWCQVSLSQCTVSGVFSALSLPYLFGSALTVNHTAATPSKLNGKWEPRKHSFHGQVLTSEHRLPPSDFNTNLITQNRTNRDPY